MSEDVWTPRRTPSPAPRRQGEFEANTFDIPFTQLTMFFVKASLAAALAMTLTSIVWIGLLATLGGVGAGVYLAFDRAQNVAVPHESSSVAAVLAVPAPPAVPDPVVAEAPPAPVEPPVAVEPPPARRTRTSAASADSATDALIRAEIEQMRARKSRGY